MMFNIPTAVVALISCLSSLTNAAALLETRQSGTAPDITDSSFIANALNRHNYHRGLRGATALTWNSTLAQFASREAQKCVLQHSGGPYGENIYWVYSSGAINFTKATLDAVDAWVSEEPQYSVDNVYPALHFTAVVWKATRRVGCAWTRTQCPTTNGQRGGYYFFCEYDPQGNILGQFPQNVQTLASSTSTSASSTAVSNPTPVTSSRAASSVLASATPAATCVCPR